MLAARMRAAGDRVRFFGVALQGRAAKYGEQSAADFGVPFPSVHDDDGDRCRAGAARRRRRRRRCFVDADGTVAGRKIGAITRSDELTDWSSATSACSCDGPDRWPGPLPGWPAAGSRRAAHDRGPSS